VYRFSLEFFRDRIADTGEQKTQRGFGNNGGIHQHQLGIARQQQDFGEQVVVVVDGNGEAGGRIGGGDGGYTDKGCAECQCYALAGIEGLAATKAYHHVDAQGFALSGQRVDSGAGHFTGEGEQVIGQAGGPEAGFELVAKQILENLVGDYQRLFAKIGSGLAKLAQAARPLDIA